MHISNCLPIKLITIDAVRQLIHGVLPVNRIPTTTIQSHVSSHLYHSSPVCLRTINQIIRNGPVKRRTKKKGPLSGHPQLKGIVLQVLIRKPKKPNSAQRKCCRVRLSNGKELTAFIPQEGHTLQEHNVVLVRGGRTQDLPGVKVKVVRGKYDCGHPIK